MVELLTPHRLSLFLDQLGEIAEEDLRVYLVGGACSLLHGWREATIDVDLHFEPPSLQFFKGLSILKRRLATCIDVVSPLEFLPELPRWRERSRFLQQSGRVSIFEFDPYSQALAKIERGHEKDLLDVEKMIDSGLVEGPDLVDLFDSIETELVRFPAIDAEAFREDLERALGDE